MTLLGAIGYICIFYAIGSFLDWNRDQKSMCTSDEFDEL